MGEQKPKGLGLPSFDQVWHRIIKARQVAHENGMRLAYIKLGKVERKQIVREARPNLEDDEEIEELADDLEMVHGVPVKHVEGSCCKPVIRPTPLQCSTRGQKVVEKIREIEITDGPTTTRRVVR